MLKSIKTLAGALCFFASASLAIAPAVAGGSPESALEFLQKYGFKETNRGAKTASEETAAPQKGSYASLVRKVAQKHGVPVKIALAVVTVESNFNPRARGGAGEIGLMQIKPATARGLGYRGAAKGLYNPSINLEWGMRYLAGAHKLASGDVCGTILRYNAGHYAKRMNPVSRRYCQKVQRILASS